MRRMIAMPFAILILTFPLFAGGPPKEELDEYGRGVIEDYSDMKEGEHVEWQWIKPGIKLSEYQFDVAEFENLSKVNDERMIETLTEGIQKAFSRLKRQGEPKGTLTTRNAVYWAERSSSGKRWIPYAGGHLAQAGVGIEMVFRDGEGNIVAKVRHSGREGDQPEDAAWELVDEVYDFVLNN